MKRLLFTLVAWGAVLLPMAAQAQRGMGFHGSSAPRASAPARGGGFAARPMGFAGRPMGRIAPAGIRSAPMTRFRSAQGRRVVIPGQRSFVSRSRFGFGHRFHNGFHHRFFNDFDAFCFNGFSNFNCVNPFLFAGFGGIGYPGDPFYADYSGYYSQPQPQPQPVIEEQDNGSRELALQVQELSDEIQAMRDQQRSREPQKSTQAQPAEKDTGPNAILVFRDGLQLPVRNYAISGDTIWVLDKPATQKIALSKLDVAATQQVNDKNGLEIHIPKAN